MIQRTSENVSIGHPDKVSDLISDKILDELLKYDPGSRVAVETLISKDFLVVAGEVTSNANVDYKKVALETIREIGYKDSQDFNPEKAVVHINIHEQSREIASGAEEGAGDQGIMYGYATNETDEYLPLPFVLAKKITNELTKLREEKGIGLKPDSKSQVTIEEGMAKEIVVAQQHEEGKDITKTVEDAIVKVCEPYMDKTTLHINSAGPFTVGGPAADTGLTGRKIMVDTYGTLARHGGGAFSGKDPSKVDRSAAYMARYIAKNIVYKGYADECEVHFAFSIGETKPLAFEIETYGTEKKPVEEIKKEVQEKLDLSPQGIIKKLDLKKPIYFEANKKGYFLSDASWEKLDLFD